MENIFDLIKGNVTDELNAISGSTFEINKVDLVKNKITVVYDLVIDDPYIGIITSTTTTTTTACPCPTTTTTTSTTTTTTTIDPQPPVE